MRITFVAFVVSVGLAAPAWAAKPTGCGPDVPVSVTISGSVATPESYRFVSDGGGTYFHGKVKGDGSHQPRAGDPPE